MNNKQFGITVFSITIAVICFLSSLFWVILAKDLSGKVNILEREKSRLEQEIIDYKWQLEQVSYICGGINEES